jgi:hypothetical protein
MARIASVHALLLVAAGAAACGGSPTSPSGMGWPPHTRTLATAHFDYHYSEGDTVDADWQEAFHEWATRELGVVFTRRITYYKYMTPMHMLALHNGPGNVNAWADPDRLAVHTIWPTDAHEVIHLYAALIGRATLVFNEGLAVAFQVDPVRGDMTPRWNNRHVHDVAISLRLQGRLPALGSILTVETFRGPGSDVSYPASGSFVRYLLDAHGGMAPMRALLSRSTMNDPPAVTRASFEAAYGRPFEEAEAAWHRFLDAR